MVASDRELEIIDEELSKEGITYSIHNFVRGNAPAKDIVQAARDLGGELIVIGLRHRTPVGKLILHATTTPVIEVAADGETAKGVWLMAGTESGLTDPEVAKEFPDMYSPGEVQGKKVWAHWVWCKYAIDFLKQDGEWKIWKFRCYELARAPFEENWISFGLKNQGAFDLDLMYFGDDGKPVFMPPADQPVPDENHPYSPSTVQKLEPVPPVPHHTFDDTFH